MRSSHTLDRLETRFDDDRLVADAGLLLPATLAHHLGLRAPNAGHERLGRWRLYRRLAPARVTSH